MLLEAFAIFVMLAILSVLIIVHEVGHFSVARLFGFQTPIFGFGLPFGPYWVAGHKWGTEFRIHACLLGGYVAIPELGDETNAREENYGVPLKPFKKFPIWQRALVAFAGVGFNILFAYLVMFTMYATMGQPTQAVAVIKMPAENPIAAKAGVKAGDKIYGIDDTQIGTTLEVINYLKTKGNTPVVLHIERGVNLDGDDEKKTTAPPEKIDINVTPNEGGKVGMVLMEKGPVTYTPFKGNIIDMAVVSADRLWKMTTGMLDALGMMFQGIFSNILNKAPAATPGQPNIGAGDLHGVLAVVAIGAEIAKQDWSQLFNFMILISLDLAIINLVPWPALDGGHLAFMAYEAVRGRPMGERAHGEIVKWGFISLLVLMAVIMVNDVRALLTGELTTKKQKQQQQKDQQKDEKKEAPPGTDQPSSTTDQPSSSTATPTESTDAPKPAP